MADIIKLEQDVYLVYGKIIKAYTPWMFEYDGGREELLGIARDMDSKYWPGPKTGELYVCVLSRVSDDLDGATSLVRGENPVSRLSVAAKEILRKELPDRAGEI